MNKHTVTIVVALVLAAGQAEAQVRYVDGQGQAHWVQTESQVPEQYRQAATTPALPGVGHGDAVARDSWERSSKALDRINEQGRAEDQVNADRRFCEEILKKENTWRLGGFYRPHPNDRRFCGL
jgi:hypothetical protein